MSRAWAVALFGVDDGSALLSWRPGMPRHSSWSCIRMSTWRDKGLARLIASGYGPGAIVQRVALAASHATKTSGRRRWDDPMDPRSGLSRRRLAKILKRRVTFGGRKGRRAAARLAEMYE